MFDLTLPDGRKIQMDGTRIIRIRATLSGEQGATRLDLTAMRMQLVMEEPKRVAELAAAELPSLMSLHDAVGKAMWFDAERVTGPVPLLPLERVGNIRSAVILFPPAKLFATETGAEVADAIRRAGGSPEPVPPEEGFMASIGSWFRSVLGGGKTAVPSSDDGPAGGATLDQ